MTTPWMAMWMATACAGLAWRAVREVRVGADGEQRLLFVGASAAGVSLIREIAARDDVRWRVLGSVTDARPGSGAAIGPWLGTMADLPAVIASTHPTRIVLAPAERRRKRASHALLDAHLAGVVVEDARDLLERVTGKLPIERLTPQGLLRGAGFRHADVTVSDLTHHIARLYSAVVAAAGLVIAAPLMAILALAIRLDSPGPVLFVQERLGMGGRPFRLYKFRTMRESRARASEWVSDNTDRITRLGGLLRRFRLDELPQLVNVVAGDMNLVGPRPHPACNGPLFLARIPHYRLRFSVRPGLTGWAQVRYGYANGLDEETEKMRYDLYYIKHRSLALDAEILLRTIGILLWDGQNHATSRQAASTVVWSGSWGDARDRRAAW